MQGEHRPAAVLRKAGYLPVETVVQVQRELYRRKDLGCDRGMQRFLGSRRIGADQAARAELGAAEVAHHRDQGVSEGGRAEQIQHGKSRRLCGFSVVRGFFDGRVSVEYVGIADMARVIVLLSEAG